MFRVENKIENDFVKDLELWGYHNNIPLFCGKLKIIGVAGFPDRIILYPNRGILFIEFKRPGERAKRIQEWQHSLLRKLGFEVEVHDDTIRALDSAKAKILAAVGANKIHADDGAVAGVQDIFETGGGKDGSGS